jgi:hypothetical protein
MTRPFATGTYTLLRGNDTDGYGDDEDVATALTGYTRLVGSVVEQSQDTKRRTDGSQRNLRRYVGRFSTEVPVQDDDRIKNNTTSEIYVIKSFRTVANPITGPTLRLELLLIN